MPGDQIPLHDPKSQLSIDEEWRKWLLQGCDPTYLAKKGYVPAEDLAKANDTLCTRRCGYCVAIQDDKPPQIPALCCARGATVR